MKKLLTIVILFSALLSLSACGNNDSSNDSKEEALQATIDSQSKEIKDLKVKNSELEKENKKQLEESKKLNDKLNSKDKEVDKLKKDITNKNNKINDLNENIEDKDKKVSQLEDNIKEQEKQVDQLKEENSFSNYNNDNEDEYENNEYDNAPDKTNIQVIRGNSNSKIYHSPGQRDYDNMANSKYLVEFNSPQEAEAAGYRAAKR